jgi:hypothetical protein
MSTRTIKRAPVAPGPGAYRVTWSADFGAATGPEDAASQARDFLADLLARGGSLPFLAERHDDKRQGKLLFGLASVPVTIKCPAALRSVRAKMPKAPPPPGLMGAEAFWSAMCSAMDAANAEHGPRWKFKGDAVMMELPARLRSYVCTGADGQPGSRIRYMRDHWAPAARYWPGGAIPAGPIVTPCYKLATKRVLFGNQQANSGIRKYARWLKAWKATHPGAENECGHRPGFGAWLRAQIAEQAAFGPDFRYDAADLAALVGQRFAQKIAKRDSCLAAARASLKTAAEVAKSYAGGATWHREHATKQIVEAWGFHRAAMALRQKSISEEC